MARKGSWKGKAVGAGALGLVAFGIWLGSSSRVSDWEAAWDSGPEETGLLRRRIRPPTGR